MATMEQVTELHNTVRNKLVPQLHVESPKQNDMLDAYLSSTGPTEKKPTADEEKQRSDRITMMRLEEHVTLDGALFFLFRLSQDLFGVSVVEDETSTIGWHSDVRVFHMLDEQSGKHLGSFLLDPYERSGKLGRPVTSPLYGRGGTSDVPIVALSLSMEPPAWDTESAPMTWDDVEGLFHEMGHVFQCLLARSDMGTLLGPDKMPFDLSEFLPKVCL